MPDARHTHRITRTSRSRSSFRILPAARAISLRAPSLKRRHPLSVSPSSSTIGRALARQSVRQLPQKPSPTVIRSLASPLGSRSGRYQEAAPLQPRNRLLPYRGHWYSAAGARCPSRANIKAMAEFTAAMRTGKLTFGSAGVGTIGHLYIPPADERGQGNGHACSLQRQPRSTPRRLSADMSTSAFCLSRTPLRMWRPKTSRLSPRRPTGASPIFRTRQP